VTGPAIPCALRQREMPGSHASVRQCPLIAPGASPGIRHHCAVASEPGNDVVEFFAARGFEVRVKRQNQMEKFRRLGLADTATADDPFWVDLLRAGSVVVVAPDYGSGSSVTDALRSATRRWVEEQAT
jgi:hypothetical protein